MRRKPIVVHIANWHTEWIIGGLFRDAAAACSIDPIWRVYPTSKLDYLKPKVMESRFNPYIGDLNIFTHQDTFFSSFDSNSEIIKRVRNRVFFTHLNDGIKLDKDQIMALSYCERILVQNEFIENLLISLGISRGQITRAPGAVNREIYRPSNQLPESKYVLFSGDFKYRKNPELIEQVITAMPETKFIVHGRNWEVFSPRFQTATPNLQRMDFDLHNQPHLMRQASLYVSLSLIEGGPYPVLEALASGTPVLATNTGFCAEFVNESTGKLLPNPPGLNLVKNSIIEVMALKKDVWDKDLLNGRWTWYQLGQLIYF